MPGQEQDWERERNAGDREGHVPQQRSSGQEELRAAHRAELERLAAEVGAAEDIGKERVVAREPAVQAYHEVTADEVLTGLRTAEVLKGASVDHRREVGDRVRVQDVELSTGERFRIMVEKLR